MATATTAVEVVNTQASDRTGYGEVVAQAAGAMAAAERQGYSPADLGPLGRALDASPSRWMLPWQGGGTYRASAATISGLLVRVPQMQAAALDQHRARASAQVAAATAAVDAAAARGADVQELDAIRAELARTAEALPQAADPHAVDALGRRAAGLGANARNAAEVAAAEQGRLQAAADALKAQCQGDLGQLRAAGGAALGPARNDATVATLLRLGTATHLSGRIEHYASLMASPDVDQVALAVAGVQSYRQQTHDALLGGFTKKNIIVSLAAQELWAYQDGKVVQDTLVTTGRPELPTDVGAMKVLSKDSPWKMHSPWPRGSSHWYPDTTVRKVVWFTVTGEGLHDAAWQPTSTYGPGGQYTASASHGCIHIPDAAENFIYDWAEVGTPVIVYPGDGSPVASQLKQVSVDADGVPLTGPKGS